MPTTMASTRRNVHVYSSSNGTEVAGESKRHLLPLFWLLLLGFFQHGGVSISTFIGWINKVCFVPGEWDLYPCQIGDNRASDGPALDRNSEGELQPGRYVMCTPPPGECARFLFVLAADIRITESAQVVVYLTTDVPRTRAYSVNNTYTPHVRFWLHFLRFRMSLTNALGNTIRNTNQGTRRALLCYRSISCR